MRKPMQVFLDDVLPTQPAQNRAKERADEEWLAAVISSRPVGDLGQAVLRTASMHPIPTAQPKKYYGADPITFEAHYH